MTQMGDCEYCGEEGVLEKAVQVRASWRSGKESIKKVATHSDH